MKKDHKPKTKPAGKSPLRTPYEIADLILAGKHRPSRREAMELAIGLQNLRQLNMAQGEANTAFQQKVRNSLNNLSNMFKHMHTGAKCCLSVARGKDNRIGSSSAMVCWERAEDFVADLTKNLFPEAPCNFAAPEPQARVPEPERRSPIRTF